MNEFNLTELECHCDECVKMCKRITCWGTPKEIQSIINAGFGDKLVLLRGYNDKTGGTVPILAPANFGDELKIETSNYYDNPVKQDSICSFLDDNYDCRLHKLGLKPIEGKAVTHNTHVEGLRQKIIRKWKFKYATIIIENWKRNFKVKED